MVSSIPAELLSGIANAGALQSVEAGQITVAQVVPAPRAVPPAVAQSAGSTSVQVPFGKQQASCADAAGGPTGFMRAMITATADTHAPVGRRDAWFRCSRIVFIYFLSSYKTHCWKLFQYCGTGVSPVRALRR
jgi:hypothetical protein